MDKLSLQGITKNFDDVEVLKGIDLTIRDGEFLSLVGPSGCGKSTLLRIIAGLESQTAGDVVIEGRNVNTVKPSARDLAMVFQSYALYPHLTVEENMMVPLRLRDLSRLERFPLLGLLLPSRWEKLRAIREAARETAEMLRIESLLQRKPGQLSGGQRQRVAVGRAMVRDPVAFLMDEPLSNLDAALRVHMRAEIAELHRQLQATVVYVTHDQAEALTMSNRVAVMMGGEILQLDTPDKVYRDPADLRVAEFIGSPKMNVLPAELGADGRVTTVAGYVIDRRLKAELQDLMVGLRPEHLEIAPEMPNIHCFPVTVRHTENLGSDCFIHAQIDGTEHKLIVRAPPEAALSLPYGAAAHVWAQHNNAVAFGADNRRLYFEEA